MTSLIFAALALRQAPPFDLSAYQPYTDKANLGDYIASGPYPDAPELTPNPNVPHGKVYQFTMDSHDSLRYPGISKADPLHLVPYHRNVHVYVPAEYVPGSPAPFMVAQDSLGWGEIPTILDNMIPEHRVPAMVGIFIDSGGSDSLGSERGLEYDTLSAGYAEFIEYEVLPRISHDYGVTFTKDPNGRMTLGGSSGAACAFTMAWYHPDFYHRVLSYSGTFVNQQWPPDPLSPHGAWEYHEHFISQLPRKPIRIWMEVGDRDLRLHPANDPEMKYHDWPLANVRMAAALKSKGYPYEFVFCKDAVHVDRGVVRQTLPHALEWVWRGYRG